MTEPRTYRLDDILTMTTGRLLSQRGIEAVYDLANYMTGDYLLTHQLPRAVEACGPALLDQHPQLRSVEPAADIDPADIAAWLVAAGRVHGRQLLVTPLPPGVWEHRDPIEELCGMIGPERVIVVATPEGGKQS